MLKSCAGTEDREVYSKFKKRYNYEEAEGLCETLRLHIKLLKPNPVCWESHQFLDEYNGRPYIVEQCIDCICFCLSRDIMEMS
ncbi:hypothetical protein AtNW77_Chr4g0279491 [Arabidopsis thaliana]